MFTRYLSILLKAPERFDPERFFSFMKLLFVHRLLIRVVILVFGIHSLLLDWILMTKSLILFANMWSLICYEWIFNVNKNNVALLK